MQGRAAVVRGQAQALDAASCWLRWLSLGVRWRLSRCTGLRSGRMVWQPRVSWLVWHPESARSHQRC
jgi:hypothetical protein